MMRPSAVTAAAEPPCRPPSSSAVGDTTASSTAAGRATASPNNTHKHKRGPSGDEGQSPESTASPSHLDQSVADPQKLKKRRTGPGSRGVANLTPEQLAKKRANDREAQRAIRERTKNQIETLEKRIQDLTSQKPYQELQAAIQAKEAVEAENAEIKQRLASIMALIQPVLVGQNGEGPLPSPATDYTRPQSVTRQPPSENSFNKTSPAQSAASPASTGTALWHSVGNIGAPSPNQQSPRLSQVELLNQQSQDLHNNLMLAPGGEHLQLGFLLDSSNAQNIYKIRERPEYAHEDLVQRPRPWTTPYSLNSAPIQNCPPTCPLDHLLLDFLAERHARAREGVPTKDIVGPKYPSVGSLLNTASSAFAHPLSKVFTDILATFPGICTLPERVAVLYIMFLIMRWQVCPSEENYELLPAWARPTGGQTSTPHPAWVDHIPFPRMRDRIARSYNMHEFMFDNYFIPFTTTISVNWPYEPTDTLLRSQDGGEFLINPVFERHLRREENWSLGDLFDETFPQLRGTYNLKHDGSAQHGPGQIPAPGKSRDTYRKSFEGS